VNLVARHIEEHLEHNDLNDSYQSAYYYYIPYLYSTLFINYIMFKSAYHRGHSTKPALLKVHSNIAEALDEGSTTAIIMLDLSAAFNIINRPILLKRLEVSFGITWVKSYLANRTLCISSEYILIMF